MDMFDITIAIEEKRDFFKISLENLTYQIEDNKFFIDELEKANKYDRADELIKVNEALMKKADELQIKVEALTEALNAIDRAF